MKYYEEMHLLLLHSLGPEDKEGLRGRGGQMMWELGGHWHISEMGAPLCRDPILLQGEKTRGQCDM